MFFDGKKVLVTGGTGFVGTHFVEELLRLGASVRVPVHRRQLIVEDPRIEAVPADLTNLQDCLAVCRDAECVIHCAGAVHGAGVTVTHNVAPITTNLVLTAQVIQAACTHAVDRILIFSSSAGYPVADYPVREDDFWSGPPHPSYFGYGWFRRYLERLGEFIAQGSGTKVAIVRPSAVYGRHDDFNPTTSHVIPALIRRAVSREDPFVVWGSADVKRDFLHISDLVKGALLVLEKHSHADAINIGFGRAVSIGDVVTLVLKLVGNGHAKVIYDTSKPTTIPVRAVDTTKARRLLGFKPAVSLEDGLRDTIQWYKGTRPVGE